MLTDPLTELEMLFKLEMRAVDFLNNRSKISAVGKDTPASWITMNIFVKYHSKIEIYC